MPNIVKADLVRLLSTLLATTFAFWLNLLLQLPLYDMRADFRSLPAQPERQNDDIMLN
jgi:hypothetical protein